MSDDVKVTFSADTSSVTNAITTINNAGGGGGRGRGGPPPTLPVPSGPAGGGRGRRMINLGYVDAETVGGGGGGGKKTKKQAGDEEDDEKTGKTKFGKVVQYMRAVGSMIEDGVEYASKVKLASLRTGLDVEKIQKLTNAGVQQGISFEEITGALIEGNRRLGQGLVNGGGVQLGLSRLGVSMQQIRDKSVNTSEVLMKMADLYQQTGDEVQMANLGASLFGDGFKSLIPLLKQGREAIKALGDNSLIMSKDEIQSAANFKRNLEGSKKMSQYAGVVLGGWLSEMLNDSSKWGFRKIQMDEDLANRSDKMAARAYYGRYSGEGESIEDFYKSEMAAFKEDALDYERKNPGRRYADSSSDNRKRAQLINGLAELAESSRPKNNMPGFRSEQIAWASTLQGMGGGDILSAMAQDPQARTAENTAAALPLLERIAMSSTRGAQPAPPALAPNKTAPNYVKMYGLGMGGL